MRASLTELGRVALDARPAGDRDSTPGRGRTSRHRLVDGERVGGREHWHSSICWDLARSLVTAPPPLPHSPPAGLTPREMEVLRRVAEGLEPGDCRGALN